MMLACKWPLWKSAAIPDVSDEVQNFLLQHGMKD